MGLMRKDVRLAQELAKKNGIEMSAFESIARLWEKSSTVLPDEADFNRIYEYKTENHD